MQDRETAKRKRLEKGQNWCTMGWANESEREGGKKVINFVTPDSICSASLPIPHIRQRASVKLFDAVAVKASVPHAAKLKSDPWPDLIAGRLSRADASDTVFGRVEYI